MIWISLAVYYILGLIVLHNASLKMSNEMKRSSPTTIFVGYLLALQTWILPFIFGLLVRGYTAIRKGK